MLKVDLHIHTADDPSDRIPYQTDELIDRAAELGFDCIAITLHDRQLDVETFRPYAALRRIVLLPGIERTIEGRHVLLLNYSRAAESVDSFEALARLRQRERGLVIAPHPFFPASSALRGALTRHAHLFDAVEWNGMFTRTMNSLVDAEPNPAAICEAIAAGRVRVVATPHSSFTAARLMVHLVASTFLPRAVNANDTERTIRMPLPIRTTRTLYSSTD